MITNLVNWRRFSSIRGERGSLLPLTFGFFLITLLLIFILVDFSSVMMRQRVLIQENEFALMKASHQISNLNYYLFGLKSNFAENEFRVPINCSSARTAYLSEIELINNEKYSTDLVFSEKLGAIEINSFECDGYKVTAGVSATYVLPLQAPTLGITTFKVSANGSATNQYNR